MPRGGIRLAEEPRDTDTRQVGSEEARVVLGAVPHWTIRWGQGALLAVLLFSLLISWFIRYPDRIQAPISLTTREVPSSVVARASGILVLLVRDDQAVRDAQPLGYLQTSASAEDVLRLKEAVARFREGFGGGAPPPPFETSRFQGADLGELGEAYVGFVHDLSAFTLWERQGGAQAQETALLRKIAEYQHLIAQSEREGALREQELALARARYEADSVLAARQLTSVLDYQDRWRAFLALQRENEGARATLTNLQITLGGLRDELLEVRRKAERDEQGLARNLERSLTTVREQIAEWEQLYVFRAPRAGRVALNRYWTNQQYVRANDEVLSIVPEQGDTVFGIIRAPLAGSGTLSQGQNVRIALADYPAAEYGELLGSVTRIAPVARDSTYRVTVALPRGLTTTAGRSLPPKHEYNGVAIITTQERRLLERLLMRPMLGRTR